MCRSAARLFASFVATAIAAAVVLPGAACADVVATSTGLATRLAPGREPTVEGLWRTGSLRRSIEPYPNLWIVADIKRRSDLNSIAKTSHRRRVRYRPTVGEPFDVVEDEERPAASRAVECAHEALPGERIVGHVIEVQTRPSANYAGSLVADVDNSHRWLLPGMHLVMAVETDRDPVMLVGIAQLPGDSVTAAPADLASAH